MEKLAALFLPSSWGCGWSCPHHTVTDIVDMGSHFGMKIVDICSKKYFVITRWQNRYEKRESFCAIHCI